MNFRAGKTLTHDWMSQHIPVWERLLGQGAQEALKVLEIGAFEGRSTLFFLQFWPQAHVTCIDTFGGDAEHLEEGSRFRTDMSEVEALFDENTRPFSDRVEKLKASSIEALSGLRRQGRRFDVIHVDADHCAASVFADAELGWQLLADGGVMILDDYEWDLGETSADRPKAGIDAFLQARSGEFELLHLDYQVIVQKKRQTPPSASSGFKMNGLAIKDLAGGMVAPPLVSFVVICWNYARYVGAAIDSIRRQDYPHFECLVIDNGSTDDSAGVIARHVVGDSRFTVETLPENLGQLGAALWSLGKIKGGFVTFVDADDVLFENYASMHVQAHMALPQGVALTSSNVAEMDADGNILTSASAYVDTRRSNLTAGLRPAAHALRVPTVTDDQYAQLATNTATLPRWLRGWIWGPGTANMYRVSVLRLIRFHDENAPQMRAADGYFNTMCHALVGSALINASLSGYRLHNANYFSAREMLPPLKHAKEAFALKEREWWRLDIDALLANVGAVSWVIGRDYWDVVDHATREHPRLIRAFYKDDRTFRLFCKHAQELARAFGPRVFCKEISRRFSGRQARQIMKAGLGGQLSLRAYFELGACWFRLAKVRLGKRR